MILPVLSSYGDQTHEYRECVTTKMRSCEYTNLDLSLKVFKKFIDAVVKYTYN